MKKLLVCLVFVLLMTQFICAPFVLAETHTAGTTDSTTAQEDTETTVPSTSTTVDATTSASDGEDTTTIEEETSGTTAFVPTDTVATNLIILDKDGNVSARLTDTNGYAIANVPVYIQLGSTIFSKGVPTDESGYADFPYEMPADTYIRCYTHATVIDGVLYAAAAASVGKAPAGVTTTTNELETSATATTVPTYNRTNKVTTANKTTTPPTWYTHSATTGMEESYISLAFFFDSGMPKAFGVNETAFANTARLLLSSEAYDKIIGDLNGTLIMSAAASATEVTDEQIAAAIQNDAVLSLTDAKNVERVVIDLALQLQSSTGKLTDVWTIAADSYVVQLPVPQSMRSAKAIAVAAVTADGISTPVYTTVSKDGFLRFESTSPVGTIVLLGIKGNLLAALTGDSAITAIIFLVLGLLCIGGAVFIYIRCFHLPKKAKKKEREAAEEVETEESVTVFEDDTPADGNERIEMLDPLDIFTETDTQTDKFSGGHHSNIDIPL